MPEQPFLTKKIFSEMIENEVRRNRLSYMDAIIHLCEKNNINMDDVRVYINPSIKGNLEVEAQNLNFLPKGNTLPDV